MGEKERAQRTPVAYRGERKGNQVRNQPSGQESGEVSLDHGAQSLVAQDSPDDSQLGAPGGAASQEPLA